MRASLHHSCLAGLLLLTSSCNRNVFAEEGKEFGNVMLDEVERVEEYHKRNYTWPLREMKPDTPGWRRLNNKRIAQVERIEHSNQRYNGWVAAMNAAVVAPNFTENGWGVTRCPPELLKELQDSLYNGLPNASLEERDEIIEGKNEESLPLFIKQEELNAKVLKELKPYHEEWSGQKLVGQIAYGLRVYRNESNLHMHIDKVTTHIISCILHVDHSEDSEPWPIFIEDFQGNVNEVVLEAGDMMFYESSKCIHGRPRPFNGSWYTSIFVHYYPEGWDTQNFHLEGHYAVPPQWNVQMEARDDLAPIELLGSSMKENTCKDFYCNAAESVKWRGPAKEWPFIISAGYKPEEDEGKDEL